MKKSFFTGILLTCGLALAAENNFYPNGGFENRDLKSNLPTSARWRWSHGNFKVMEYSAREAHSGKYSLHLKDVDAGKSNSCFMFVCGMSDFRRFANKIVVFSAWCKVVSASPNARIGLSILGKNADGKFFSRIQTQEPVSPPQWKRLTVTCRIPEKIRFLGFRFLCSNGYSNTGEAYFDDAEISIIDPGTKEVPADRTTQNPAKHKYREAYEKPVVFTDDNHVRPKIVNGTWQMNGKPEFLVGGFVGGGSAVFKRDWPKGNPNRQGIAHFAYDMPPSRQLFDKIGFNSAQVSGAFNLPGQVLYGLTSPDDFEAKEQDWRDYYRGFDGIPLTVEFSFGFDKELKREMPQLAREIQQKNYNWHDFIPFCPEDPRGDRYYQCFMRGGVISALKNNANIFCWELFNESSYNCQCEFNRAVFALEMREKFGSIRQANRVWGTAFRSFDEVAAANHYEQYAKLWPDWCKFSSRKYAGILRKYAADIRTIDRRENVCFTEQIASTNLYTGRGAGMDYRLIAEVLDSLTIEGGWRYGWGAREKKSDSGMEDIVVESRFTYPFVADLFQALGKGKKPVENHEHYCARFENGIRTPSRKSDIISSLWAEIMHGLSTVYVYSWDKRSWQWTTLADAEKNALARPYRGYSFLNPYNWPPGELSGFKLFENELAPWKEKILPFPRFKAPSVAVFYSYPTLRMEGIGGAGKNGDFKKKMLLWHNALMFAHYPLTFVFENELEAGLAPGIQALILPDAAYVEAGTLPAIKRFIARGGLVIADRNAMKFDERGNPVAGLTDKVIRLDAADSLSSSKLTALLKARQVRRYVELDDSFKACEIQLIDRGDWKIVFLLNWEDPVSTHLGTLKINSDDSGEFYVFDPVGKLLLTNGRKETWNRNELMAGIEIPVPPQKRALLILQRNKPKDMQGISPSQLRELFKQTIAKEAPNLARYREMRQQGEIQYFSDRKFDGVRTENCRPVDLTRFANMGFRDKLGGDGKGGWTDQGPNRDFADMPLGKQVLAGVPFTIIDPARNHGKSVLVLYGKEKNCFPKQILGIPVNGKAAKLYFLHTAAWGGGHSAALRYVIHYADGAQCEIPILCGEEIEDWCGSRIPKSAKIAIESNGRNLQCFRWINPHPEKMVDTLDLVSLQGDPVPLVVAVTVER